MPSRILVDANVLHSRTLRDWLLITEDAGRGLFSTLWTEDIVVETLNTIRRRDPNISGGSITRLRARLVDAMAEQIKEYEAPSNSPIADPLDRHVHGAAIAGRADMLLTCDKGFLDLPEAVSDNLPYEIIDPDSLFILIDDSATSIIREVTHRQWEYWRKKDPSTDLAVRMLRAGCPDFAERVSSHVQRL